MSFKKKCAGFSKFLPCVDNLDGGSPICTRRGLRLPASSSAVFYYITYYFTNTPNIYLRIYHVYSLNRVVVLTHRCRVNIEPAMSVFKIAALETSSILIPNWILTRYSNDKINISVFSHKIVVLVEIILWNRIILLKI